MDTLELDDIDPFNLFDVEVARLDEYFSLLGPDDWLRPSRCAGWSVRDVLAHLAGEEMYNHACLNDDIDGFFATLRREGVVDSGGFGDFNQWCVDRCRDTPVGQVLHEWRTANAETRERMRGVGRDGLLQTASGPYPAGPQALHYSSEIATHADDVAATGRPGEEPRRTRWRARVGRAVLKEQGSEAEVTEAAGNMIAVRVGDLTAKLPERDFVEATVDRLPPGYPINEHIRDALICLA